MQLCSNRVKFNFTFRRIYSDTINSNSDPNKIKESKREYYLRNKERIKEATRERYLKNKEKINETNREYYLKNKEKIKEANRENKGEYYEKNKEKIKKATREYHLKNVEKINKVKRESYMKNKEKITKGKRELYKKNREKYIERYIQKKKKVEKNYVHRKCQDWNDINIVRKFLEDAGKSFGITDLSSWYRVSKLQIYNKGGSGLIAKYLSIGFALKRAYPDYPWDMSKFYLRSKKSAQRWLTTLMTKLLPNAKIVEDYRGHPSLKRKETNRTFELDIWIEEYNLALEYQGAQHYIDLPGSGFRELEDQRKRDDEKMAMCVENGIILVQIPHWWDGTIESLSSTLHQYLPNVFHLTDSPPISKELPLDCNNKRREKIRPLSMIMNGSDYEDEDPEGYYMSEKLDGIRGYWDGEQLWSKNASIINVPESFKAGFPSYPLDGELWSGYGEDDLTVFHLKKICRKKIIRPIDWKKIHFHVFDTPHIIGTYDKRHSFLQNNIPLINNPNISLIPMQRCNGKDHLLNYLEDIINKKGEGIMIYNPSALYQPGRSRNVLKVKKYFECYVKFLNLCEKSYNFVCEQENGGQSNVKCSPEFYRNPPHVGDKFLVRHLGNYPHSPNYKYPVLVEVEPIHEPQESIKQLKKNKTPVNKNVE